MLGSYEYRDCSNELSVILTGKITMLFPELQVDLQRQLEVKKTIDEALYKYEVTSKETALVTSDIEQKARLYIQCKKIEGLSPKTIYNYSLELNKFSQFLHKPISTINSMDIRMYMAAMAEHRSESTTNTKMTVIRDFFHWLQNEEYIISNPTKKIKPVKEPKRERQPLTDEEVEIIRESLEDIREKAMFEFLLSTGCRADEVVNVKISDIDWSKMSLMVVGKGNKERRIYFNQRTKVILRKYLEVRDWRSEYLFCSLRGKHGKIGTRALQKVISNIGERVGIHLYPHLMRHTFATRALNAGMALEIVQALLGHSNVGTTQIYAKVKEFNIQHAYRQLVA